MVPINFLSVLSSTLKKSLEFAISNEHENLRKNTESALANRHCIAALVWAERVKHHHVRVTIVNVTNFKIVTSIVYIVTQCL